MVTRLDYQILLKSSSLNWLAVSAKALNLSKILSMEYSLKLFQDRNC